MRKGWKVDSSLEKFVSDEPLWNPSLRLLRGFPYSIPLKLTITNFTIEGMRLREVKHLSKAPQLGRDGSKRKERFL